MKKTKAERSDLRFYNVKKHQIIIWVLIGSTFLVAVFGIPWLIGFVKWVFSWIPLWQKDATVEGLDLGVLPDFLGGMVGILVGFLMEWLLFSQLKTLSKYKAFLLSLDLELNSIYDLLISENEYNPFIKIIVLDDIILIADNNAVFYSLPKFPRSKSGELFKCLLEIYGAINKYNLANRNLLKAEENKNEKARKKYNDELNESNKSILKGIKTFFAATGIELKNKTEAE